MRLMHPSIVIPALFAASALFLSCYSTALTGKSDYRRIHVKIVADSSYAGSPGWKQNVATLIDATNKVYRSWADVEFVIDTVQLTNINPATACFGFNEYECIVTTIPKGGSDLVIYLAKESQPGQYHLGGVSLYEFGYVYVSQMGWQYATEPFKWAFVTLVHELGHTFGAMHIYPSDDSSYIMEPSMADQRPEREGKGYHFADPEFDAPNAAIVRTLARIRPFHDSLWSDSLWPVIRAAYDRAFRMGDSWKLDGKGRLRELPVFHFMVLDRYFYLATFASLCGRDSTALGYTDSITTVTDALRNAGAPKNKAVLYLDRQLGPEWPTVCAALRHQLRAYVLLRAGKRDDAQEEMMAFVNDARTAEIPQKAIDREMSFFSWMRERQGRVKEP